MPLLIFSSCYWPPFGNEGIHPGQDGTQVIYMLEESFRCGQILGRRPEHVQLAYFLDHAFRRIRLNSKQQPFSCLTHQINGRGNSNVGQDMGCILQPQAIFDQSAIPGLERQSLGKPPSAFRPPNDCGTWSEECDEATGCANSDRESTGRPY